ncbi:MULTISPECIES: thiamine pyrophosphate-binding protein [Nocardiaceae]|uniref:acetolactate synthase n=1 Tax=Rhodococcoides corynebacterioides TaxID=53972 RepID=A0ABS2KMW4_9NOCA|nr:MULTISPECIES: thiamine pyrophosphate-binding protein [Rhodococcus]MBM7413321.1 thiamine pyrophosphate-dependent acetolactate synthase large subunit-like protein [Rhodococcus corynebacterioides]MBP1115784.1 thiamine pyrophosphate-dependent acetolactate synthase large subunit-like protein [Rhodococcus sp. PvP016]
MTRTVAHLVADVLADLGVGHIFGVVGSGNFDVTNALIARGIPYTAARHEGGAASMADGFARLAALPAIVSVHQGCGLTNAMTGIGEAAKSRTPVIVLAADVAASSRLSNFRIDQDALARSVGAVAERVHSAATAVADVTRAWQTAVHDRRTVVLNLPLDVQSAPAPEHVGTAARPSAPEPVRPAQSAVEQFVALLEGATRPVFVTGRGGRAAGPHISALAEHAGALVATSAVANGLFRGEEFDLGISGGFSAPLTAQLISDADLVVGWGCALNMWTMRHGSLIGSHARVVQIDDTASALGAHRPIDLGLHGDCTTTAVDVLTELRRTSGARTGYRTPEVSTELAARRWWNDTETEDLSTSQTIDPRPFTKALDEMLPTDRVVAIDSGNFMGYPSTYLRVPDHMGFCFTQAFQSIGLGLSSGIGAALARPDRLAVVGTGDGGFMMGISELDTAIRLGRPMLIAVYNDAAYGAEVHHFQHLPRDGAPADLTTVTFPDIDIAAVARGHGAHGVTVRTLADLDEVRRWAAAPDGVMVVDAKIAADGGAWWLAEAFKGH